MLATTDADIRTALHLKRLKPYCDAPDTIVVNELGIAHAKARIDIAVINACIHGYEIKSSVDRLDRFPAQLDIYRRCLGKLTLVVAPTHLERIQKMAPEWCGILAATKGRREAVTFTTVRRTKANPDIEVALLAHLLWRQEAVALLARLGASPNDLRQSRKFLYARLAEIMSVKDLTTSIREFMQQRSSWRDPLARA